MVTLSACYLALKIVVFQLPNLNGPMTFNVDLDPSPPGLLRIWPPFDTPLDWPARPSLDDLALSALGHGELTVTRIA